MQRRPNNNDLSVVTVVEMVTHPNPGPDTDLSVVTVVAMVAESLPSSAHLALAVDLPQALSTCIALAFAAILAFMLAHVLTHRRESRSLPLATHHLLQHQGGGQRRKRAKKTRPQLGGGRERPPSINVLLRIMRS